MSESESDDDLLRNNAYANGNTIISARGPHVNTTITTGPQFPYNVSTSTYNMPVNFKQQRYAGSYYDQRSMSYRRGLSPMSLRGSDFGSRNYNHSAYRNYTGSRSMYNGRSRSPMSLRSIDSTATTAGAVVFDIQNNEFTSQELRMMHKAIELATYRHKRRRRIEKRYKKNLLLNTNRQYEGHSSELGSDSSISSDNGRSIRTTITYKENLPRFNNMSVTRPMSHNMSQFNTNVRENKILKDGTDSRRMNTLSNKSSISSNISNYGTKEKMQSTTVKKHQNPNPMNTSMMTHKERFKNGFLLPSQRFNQSVTASNRTNDNTRRIFHTAEKSYHHTSRVAETENGSDPEEIFRGFSQDETLVKVNKKRTREIDPETDAFNTKRSKLLSPKSTQNSNISKTNEQTQGFIFVKPKIPMKIDNLRKNSNTEKLITKSKDPVNAQKTGLNILQNTEHIEEDNIDNNSQSNILHTTKDVSQKPSFSKRKLFSQKLDVAENKNLNCSSNSTNSQQDIHTAATREKNKARKIINSQSCLSRDIEVEDNNVLDLIHKIVPPDQINLTNVANKMDLTKNNPINNKVGNTGKWDVNTAILSCNNRDVSDTFSDEEIFNMTYNNVQPNDKDKPAESAKNLLELPKCKVVAKRLTPRTENKFLKKQNNYEFSNSKMTNGVLNEKRVSDCVRSFWDTDFESDTEFSVASSSKNTIPKSQGTMFQEKTNTNKANTSKSNTQVLTARNCHKNMRLNIFSKHQRNQIAGNETITEDKESAVKHSLGLTNTNSKKDSQKDFPVNNKQQGQSDAFRKTKTSGRLTKKDIGLEQGNKNNTETKYTNNIHDSEPTQTKKASSNKISESDNKKKNPEKKDRLNNNKRPHSDTPRAIKTSVKLNKKEIGLQPRNKNTTDSNKTTKPKDASNICTLEPRQSQKASSSKMLQSAQKLPNTPQQNGNLRKQPHRMSKEKSFTRSTPEINNIKVSNSRTKTKSDKTLASENSSSSSFNITLRCLRERSFVNCRSCDQSSLNVSNASTRNLRSIKKT